MPRGRTRVLPVERDALLRAQGLRVGLLPFRGREALWGVALLLCVGFGCSDHVQFAEPPERGAKTAPGAASGSAKASGETEIPMHGTRPEPEAPGAGAPPEARAPILFSGRITAPSGLQLPSRFSLFISAGDPPQGRPPRLNRRYEGSALPLDFQLTSEDIPFGDAPEEGLFVLYAVLRAADGVASELSLTSEVTAEVPLGTKGLEIVLRSNR